MLLGRTGSLRYQPKTLLEFFGRGANTFVKELQEGSYPGGPGVPQCPGFRYKKGFA